MAGGNQTVGAVNWFWFPVPDQELIWSRPKPYSYFCACSPEGSVEQAVTQTRLMFLAEHRNFCDTTPKFISTALGSNCLRKMELWLEVSRAVFQVAVFTCPGTQVLPCFLGRAALGERQYFKIKRKEAFVSHQNQSLTFPACSWSIVEDKIWIWSIWESWETIF